MVLISYRVLCPSALIVDSKVRLQDRICDLIVSRKILLKYRPIEQIYLLVVEGLQPQDRPEMTFAKYGEKNQIFEDSLLIHFEEKIVYCRTKMALNWISGG